MTEERGRKLETWIQIAGRLGCSLRQAMRYLDDPAFPVYRAGGSRHTRVFAYTRELEKWQHHRSLTTQKPNGQPSPAEDRLWQLAEEPAGPSSLVVQLTADEYVLGREPGAGIVIDDPRVSRRHARLCRIPAGYQLEDLHSRNGTFLNSRPVTEPVPLSPGDRINLGRGVTFIFQFLHAAETMDDDGPPSLP